MELRFAKEKKQDRLLKFFQKLWIFVIYNEENFGNIPKQLMFLNKNMAIELWFSMEKLWHYGKNYGTMEKTNKVPWKTIILYWKVWKFDLYEKNYGTIEKTMVL